MLIGYIRVSKGDDSQLLDLQRKALLEAGVRSQKIYEDLDTGRKDNRPGLEKCLKSLHKGDILVIWKLDRLGQDLKHLIKLMDTLTKKDIGLKVLTGQGAQIDATSPNHRSICGIFSALAEFERDLVLERTKAGLTAARSRGRKGGRPRKMDASTIKMAIHEMSNPKSVAAETAKRLGITTTTLYTYVNGDGSLKEKGHKILRKFQNEPDLNKGEISRSLIQV